MLPYLGMLLFQRSKTRTGSEDGALGIFQHLLTERQLALDVFELTPQSRHPTCQGSMVATVLTKLTGDLVYLVLNGLLALPEIGDHRRDALQLYLCPTDLPEQSLTLSLQCEYFKGLCL